MDGKKHTVYPDRKEVWNYLDGSVLTVDPNGQRELVLLNGQREIHTGEYKVCPLLLFGIISLIFNFINISIKRLKLFYLEINQHLAYNFMNKNYLILLGNKSSNFNFIFSITIKN